MSIIVHIADRELWERAKRDGSYEPDTLRSQGFIHCSKPDQVIRVANFLFRGKGGLVLLCLDSDRVLAEIRYENLEGGRQLFPHIYGPLNAGAVVEVLDFSPLEDGTFALPEALRTLGGDAGSVIVTCLRPRGRCRPHSLDDLPQ